MPAGGAGCRRSPQQVTGGRVRRRWPGTPWPAAAVARTARYGQHERAGRTGPHRPGELAVRLASGRRGARRAGPRRRRRARWWRSRASDAHRWRRARRSTCSAASAQRPRSIANSASSDSLRTSVSVLDIAAASGGRLREQRSGPVDVADEQMRLGAQAQRRVAPRAPRRLLGDREARVGHHLLRAGGTHHGPQHRPRRVERRGAIQRHQVERSGVDDRRPPFAPRRSARSTPRSSRPARRAADSPRWRSRRARRASAARSTSARPGRSAGPARSPAGRIGPARSCSAGARGPSPGIRWTRTSRRPAGAASSMTSGSTRRSSPSRNSRNSAW